MCKYHFHIVQPLDSADDILAQDTPIRFGHIVYRGASLTFFLCVQRPNSHCMASLPNVCFLNLSSSWRQEHCGLEPCMWLRSW